MSKVRGVGVVVGLLVLCAALGGPVGAAPGDPAWIMRFAGATTPTYEFDIQVAPDGTAVYVTGASGTVAYRADTGETLWTQSAGAAVVVSPDGATVYVTGSGGSVALKASTGAIIWQQAWRGSFLVVSPDGARLFATTTVRQPGSYVGVRRLSEHFYDYLTVSAAADTGVPRWRKRFDGPKHGQDIARGISLSPDGRRVFVTGSSEDAGPGDYGFGSDTAVATVAYGAQTGRRLWVARRYAGPVVGSGEAIAVGPRGATVFVTGYRGPGAAHDDIVTMAYRAVSGDALWTRYYDGPDGKGDRAYDIAVSPLGSKVFVTGYRSVTGGSTDIATVAFGARSGARIWVDRYAGPAGFDVGQAITVSPDGATVFVTGWSEGAGTTGVYGFGQYHDYVTIAARARDGTEVWTHRLDGPGASVDEAYALATSPDGSRLYVTGLSTDLGNVKGYATVAYAAI